MTATLKGVQFNAPPAERIGPIMQAVNDAAATLAPDESMALVAVGNESGVNAVWVARVHDQGRWKVEALAWIGKEWKGSFDYGAAVRVARKM